MIETIRQKLIRKYTALIAAFLLLCCMASYAAYRFNMIKFVNNGLRDYLNEEVFEAREFGHHQSSEPRLNKVKADISTLHNFSYWFVDHKLIYAEVPPADAVAEELLRRLTHKNYLSGKIYHENIKRNKQKWYFLLIGHEFKLKDGKTAQVFVLSNYTPVRKSTRTYVKMAIAAVLVLTLLAFFIGSWLARRSMSHITQMYQKQKQFVSDAAHELRTPLSILLSYVELLEHKPDDPQLIVDLKQQIMQLNNLLDNLLNIARYDNSDIPLKAEKLEMNKWLSAVTAAFASSHADAQISFEPLSASVWTDADETMLRQLLYIMLDNAVKYTGKNKKISLKLNHDSGNVSIKIKDNGVGIAAQDLPHIFEKFWRADKSRNTKGLGLGLSLAELIVKLHHGQINVKSEPEQGTEFEIILPRRC